MLTDYQMAIVGAFKRVCDEDITVRVVELFAIPDYVEYLEEQDCIDKDFGRFTKLLNAQLQFIFEACEPSERFPLGVKTTYRAYSSDEVIELWNPDKIQWKEGILPPRYLTMYLTF
jgi:hypothetical protein